MNRAKALYSIKLIKNSGCETDVLDAVHIKEKVDWSELDELKDQWNDYYGNAKAYLP